MIRSILLFLIIMFSLTSCHNPSVSICDMSGTQTGRHASVELTKYLDKMYENVQFISDSIGSGKEVNLVLNEQARALGINNLPGEKESFKIAEQDGKMYIISPDERGLLNAVYALLEKKGCGFYISGDVIPEPVKWKGFNGWEMKDRPLTGDRFLFNWHNFLSGCTGWDLEHWKQWIDQANKMRYNGIMVHAYGNNPMFSFSYLGEKKKTGYLNNTASGRDWGNQHVNDVRRLTGGEIFNEPVYGAAASLVAEERKEEAATHLMQDVFQYAEECGTRVIFALDFDTWMANPANIINELPEDAVIEIKGHVTPNPEHPDGYAYYKQVLKSLLEMYPQIDQLAVWHRRPGQMWNSGTIWMRFPVEKFPESWKKEYRQKLEEHPDIEDNLAASSIFAYSKVIIALQKARDEIKPELEISDGSWRFDFVEYADAFFPQNVALLPLDWSVVFDTPEAAGILTKAGANRDVYPIIWAHHDDHRYIGKPYTPWEKLADRLKDYNAKGFGIIHWTTRPLDLYFTSSARQVWQNSANEPLEETVKRFAEINFKDNKEDVSDYYFKWMTEGPMFGRETSDHFVDLGRQTLGHKMESWEEIRKKAEERLSNLEKISENENTQLLYQKGMEEFYISFCSQQELFQQAFELEKEGDTSGAREIIQQANPDEAIIKYVEALKDVGFTPGEKALVFSMNTRWKADFINLRQRLGLDPVSIKFSPTLHDPLAQSPGHYSYFIDETGNWFRCIWEHEFKEASFIRKGDQTGAELSQELIFELRSMHGQAIPEGNYELKMEFAGDDLPQKVEIIEEGKVIKESSDYPFKFVSGGGELKLHIYPKENSMLCSLSIVPVQY